jgi:4-aminobutyrate aminotransferase
MISENELDKLSFSGAPHLKTAIPGPKVRLLLEESSHYESITRGGGLNPVVMYRGFGAAVEDPDGNLFIDMSAGVAVSSVGRSHPKIVEAVKRQSSEIMHATDTTNPSRISLSKRISSIMPEGLKDNCRTILVQSGSSAVETAVKFARKYTGRSQIIAFHGAYHGVWCGTAALTTGYKYRHGWGPLMPGVIHVPYAYCYRCPFGLKYPGCDLQCAKYLDYILNTPYTGADDVAAVIVEAEQGEGGYVAPPPEFFQLVKKACDKYGALLIADEVQCGAGRTGKMWGIEYSGVTPDMVAWGKGMGGDFPMAGLTYRSDIENCLLEGSQPGTFAGNSLGCEICLANIDIITDENSDLMGRAVSLGNTIKDKLVEASKTVNSIGEVRGYGLMIGVELVSDQSTGDPAAEQQCDQIIYQLLNKGIIINTCGRYGNVLRIAPPLTIPSAYAVKSVDAIIEVLKRYGN